PCMWGDGALDVFQAAHVDGGIAQTPRAEHIASDLDGAVVRVGGDDDVRARRERLEDRSGRRRTGREAGGRAATLELREAALEGGAVGVRVARVEMPGREAQVRLPLEGRGQRDGRRDRARE